MDERNDAEKRSGTGYVGWAAYGLFTIGTASALVAVLALVNTRHEPDFLGAGLCLIASALGFGLLLNGMLRR